MAVTATRDLAPEAWSEYLDAATRELVNAPVLIEVTTAPGRSTVEAEPFLLRTLAYDQGADTFEVTVARNGPQVPALLRHFVDHPTRISVDGYALLAPIKLAVDGPSGMRTVVTIERQPEPSD